MLWKIDEVLVVYDISNSSYIVVGFIFRTLTVILLCAVQVVYLRLKLKY